MCRRTSIWRRRGLGGWRWRGHDGGRRSGAGLLRCRRRTWSRCRRRWRDRAQGRRLRLGSWVLRDLRIEWLEWFRRGRCGRRCPGLCGRCDLRRGRLVADMLLITLKGHPLAVRHLPQVYPAPAKLAWSAVAGHRPLAQPEVPPMVATLQAVVIMCGPGCREAFLGVAPICELVDRTTRRRI